MLFVHFIELFHKSSIAFFTFDGSLVMLNLETGAGLLQLPIYVLIGQLLESFALCFLMPEHMSKFGRARAQEKGNVGISKDHTDNSECYEEVDGPVPLKPPSLGHEYEERYLP